MGKALIIKGADFSANALGTIEEMYEDITDELIQGCIASSGAVAKLFNSSYNSSSALIPLFLILMSSSTQLYDSQNKGVEWYLPDTLQFLPFAHKLNSTIASDGTISDISIDIPVTPGVSYIVGTNTWLKASDIYTKRGVSSTDYPCYGGSICRIGASGSLSLAEAKALGFKVRRLKE